LAKIIAITRPAYELCFAVYAGFLILHDGLPRPAGIPGFLEHVLISAFHLAKKKVPYYLSWHSARHMVFDWWAFLALAVLVLVLSVGRFKRLQPALRFVIGVIAVAGPILDRYDPQDLTWNYFLEAPWWVLVETGVVLACVLMFFLRKWLTNIWILIAILCLHFSLFAALKWGGGLWKEAMFFGTMLVLPFITSVLWSVSIDLACKEAAVGGVGSNYGSPDYGVGIDPSRNGANI
jgi:hypothetical protein